MTRGQRRAHLVMWLIVAPACLAVLAYALVTRPAPIVNAANAGDQRVPADDAGASAREGDGL